jgi:hypothetical protein
VIFRRPDAGLVDGFATADGAGGLSLAGGEDCAELLFGGSVGGGIVAVELGGTSTFVNVLCESTLVEGSMLWMRVASQSVNVESAWRVTLRAGWRIHQY